MKNYQKIIPVLSNGANSKLLKLPRNYHRSNKWWYFGTIKISLNIYSVVTNVVTTAIVKLY